MPIPSIYSILSVGRGPLTGVSVLNKGNSSVNAGQQVDLGSSGNVAVACLVSSTQSTDGIDSVTVGGVSIPAATTLLNWSADFGTSRHRLFLAPSVTVTGLQDYEVGRATGDFGFDAIFIVVADVVSVGAIVQPAGQVRDTGEVYTATVSSNADSLIVNLIQRDRKNAVGVLNASGGSTVTNHDSHTFGFSVARKEGSGGSVGAAASAIMIVRGLAFSVQGSSGSPGTANGVTVTGAASLIAGSASGAASSTASGRTLAAAASLIAGAASGVVNGTLNFQAAGMEFGARTGLGIGTFALDAGVSYRYTIHANGLTLGNPLHTSSAINLDSAGKLPNYVGTAVAPGTTYRVVAIRQTDGEAAIFSMVAA